MPCYQTLLKKKCTNIKPILHIKYSLSAPTALHIYGKWKSYDYTYDYITISKYTSLIFLNYRKLALIIPFVITTTPIVFGDG